MAKPSTRSGHVATGPEPGIRGRLVVVLLLALIPYLNTWNHPFVYDDRALITENDAIRTLSPATLLRPELGRYAVEWYRPLTLYSLAANYRVGALSPISYHVTNIALHTANTALVYAIGIALLRSSWAAAI